MVPQLFELLPFLCLLPSQYFHLANIPFRFSGKRKPPHGHIASNAVNCFFEYMGLYPVVTHFMHLFLIQGTTDVVNANLKTPFREFVSE